MDLACGLPLAKISEADSFHPGLASIASVVSINRTVFQLSIPSDTAVLVPAQPQSALVVIPHHSP